MLLLAGLALTGSALAGPPAGEVDGPAHRNTWGVWMSPIPCLISYPLFDDDPLQGTFDFPVGASYALGPKWSVVAEASVLAGWGSSAGATGQGTRNYTQIAVAVGPQISLSGPDAFNGMFLLPKFIGVYWWDRRIPASNATGNDSVAFGREHAEFQLGVDFGYQVSWRWFYFASFVGVSSGYGTVNDTFLPGPIFTEVGSGTAGPRFLFTVNMNFFRVGATF